MSSFYSSTSINLNYISLTGDDEKMYCQLLKLIKLRISGLRKDLLIKHKKDCQRFFSLENEKFDGLVEIEPSALISSRNYELVYALKSLSFSEYELLDSYFFQGFTLKEIAKSRGVSVQAIFKQKAMILSKLRNLMEGE